MLNERNIMKAGVGKENQKWWYNEMTNKILPIEVHFIIPEINYSIARIANCTGFEFLSNGKIFSSIIDLLNDMLDIEKHKISDILNAIQCVENDICDDILIMDGYEDYVEKWGLKK